MPPRNRPVSRTGKYFVVWTYGPWTGAVTFVQVPKT